MNYQYESDITLKRAIALIDFESWAVNEKDRFIAALQTHFPSLFKHLIELYGSHYDLVHYINTLVDHLARAFKKNSQNEFDPSWIKSEKTVGIALYVDLYAEDLNQLRLKLDFLHNMGIRYVHLMPLYDAPKGNNDGGYAVSDYRTVDSRLGKIEDLRNLARALHKRGMKLVLDFVFNHTSDEHQWAKRAIEGDIRYQEFYHLFENESEVREYNQTVREIFPQVRRGSFTHSPEMDRWVWTTFNSFQWDLNYNNPDVFVSITDEMLFLADLGCDVLRLDALAFIWKEKGTVCENLPKAHTLIKAFNCCLRIAAPQVLFKSEAIVHPDEVNKYISSDECELSYNPLAMALMWESLATRDTALLTQSLQKSYAISNDCSWVNYIRCHDDIGWTWDDEISNSLGINGSDHRRFLNQFYTGNFAGSFAKGAAFQQNSSNGDCRVCGTLSSLAGVEKALEDGNEQHLEHALKRVALLNAINLSLGGIPLLYQGDDLGVFNSFEYLDDANKAEDARWVNRKKLTQSDFERALNPNSVQGKIHATLKKLIHIRQSHSVFGDAETQIIDTLTHHIFSFIRTDHDGNHLLVIANFSEHYVDIHYDFSYLLNQNNCTDLIKNKKTALDSVRQLGPYQVVWLKD